MEASHLLGLRVDIPASTHQPWKTANEVTQSALQVSLPALRGIKDYYFLRRQSPAPDILRCGRYTLLACEFPHRHARPRPGKTVDSANGVAPGPDQLQNTGHTTVNNTFTAGGE